MTTPTQNDPWADSIAVNPDVQGSNGNAQGPTDLGLDGFSLGADINLQEAKTGLKENTLYAGVVKNIRRLESRGAQYLVFTYADVVDETNTVDEWKKCGPVHQMDDGAKKWLKIRLESLGVPESAMNSLDPRRLVGTPITFKCKRNDKGYMGVTQVNYRDSSQAVSESLGNSPAQASSEFKF